MSGKVSSFLSVNTDASDYLVFVINESPASAEIQSFLRLKADQFGENVGLRAKIIQAYGGQSQNCQQELMDKNWPEEIREQFTYSEGPFVLVIDTDFKAFDPSHDNYGLVSLPMGEDEVGRVYNILTKMENVINNDDDLFAWISSISNDPENSEPLNLQTTVRVNRTNRKGSGGISATHDWCEIRKIYAELLKSKSPPKSISDAATKIQKILTDRESPVPAHGTIRNNI